MSRFFDCLSCSHSLTNDEGNALFCAIRKEWVGENSICLAHTDLEYAFPNALTVAQSKSFYEKSDGLITYLEELEERINNC